MNPALVSKSLLKDLVLKLFEENSILSKSLVEDKRVLFKTEWQRESQSVVDRV